MRACVVSIIVKRPVLQPCAVDRRSRNPNYYYYYYQEGYISHKSLRVGSKHTHTHTHTHITTHSTVPELKISFSMNKATSVMNHWEFGQNYLKTQKACCKNILPCIHTLSHTHTHWHTPHTYTHTHTHNRHTHTHTHWHTPHSHVYTHHNTLNCARINNPIIYEPGITENRANTILFKPKKPDVMTYWSASSTQKESMKGKLPAMASNSPWEMKPSLSWS